MHKIYLLLCPDSGEVRYVGKTHYPLSWRLSGHLTEAKRLKLGHRGDWLRSLIAQGKKPAILLDIEVPEGADWGDVERARIAHYRGLGCRLVNGTDGGDGLRDPTEAVRAKMSASAKCRRYSEEARQRLAENAKRVGALNRGRKKPPGFGEAVGARAKGKKHTDETRAKMRVAQSARKVRKPHTDETKAKIRAAITGRKLSEEHKAKISAGLLRRPGEHDQCQNSSSSAPSCAMPAKAFPRERVSRRRRRTPRC